MITQTSEIAIKALIYLARCEKYQTVPPATIAGALGCSPSYLRKVTGQLAKAALVEARRGPHGGVRLAADPRRLTLLEIVEATQGLLIGAYCRGIGDDLGPVCAYHKAMWDVRKATRDALARWTLQDLLVRPLPTGELAANAECKMRFIEDWPDEK